MSKMNSRVISNIFSMHKIVYLLGLIFCIVWSGRHDSFIFTLVNALICWFMMVITANIKTNYYKLVTLPFLVISFLLCLLKLVFKETEQPVIVAGVLVHITDFVALSYAFVVPLFASASENVATWKRKDNVYKYPAYIFCPLFMMLSFFSGVMICVIIIGAFAGVLASGFVKNRLLTSIAFVVLILFMFSIPLVSILGIDKIANKDETKVVQFDNGDKTDKILHRIHTWSNQIYSIGSTDKETEAISAQEMSVAPTKVHHITIFVALRDKIGNWAYCIPLILLGCIARITMKSLKYSDVVYQKILGNIMTSTLFVMILADLIIPYRSDEITGFSFVVMAVMIGVTISCIKSAKDENEKYYSLSD